jgi:hypothetical protein
MAWPLARPGSDLPASALRAREVLLALAALALRGGVAVQASAAPGVAPLALGLQLARPGVAARVLAPLVREGMAARAWEPLPQGEGSLPLGAPARWGAVAVQAWATPAR